MEKIVHPELIEVLRCPVCIGSLKCTVYSGTETSIEEGTLLCEACADWYRIEQGIADLLPPSLRRHDRHNKFAAIHGVQIKHVEGQASAQKTGQVDFFTESSKTYEDEITQSPYFMALDSNEFMPWARETITHGGHILEIGCGSGRQSLPMALAGGTVLGVDISEEMLRVGRKKAAEQNLLTKVNFIVADADNLPVAPESFNHLVIVGALHHMEDPRKTLHSVLRGLASGGRFFFYDPHDTPLRFLFDWLMSVCKLYDEQAGDDPLFSEEQMKGYFKEFSLEGEVRISTYLPPHLFYLFGARFNRVLLHFTDVLCNAIPGFRRCGGMIVSKGIKKA